MSINTTAEIITLLSEQTTLEERTLAANNIINDYNLHLTVDEILIVFGGARYNIKHNDLFYMRYEYLLNFLLTKNTGMFAALIKAKNYDTGIVRGHQMIIFIKQLESFEVGCDTIGEYKSDFIVLSYKILLNYNDFNIDNLALPEIVREQIQEYRYEKYGGKFTKAVN